MCRVLVGSRAADRGAEALRRLQDEAPGSDADVLQLDLSSLGIDMSLLGHIHRDTDDWSPPYDISTDNASGSNRPFRLIRFAGGSLVLAEETARKLAEFDAWVAENV